MGFESWFFGPFFGGGGGFCGSLRRDSGFGFELSGFVVCGLRFRGWGFGIGVQGSWHSRGACRITERITELPPPHPNPSRG